MTARNDRDDLFFSLTPERVLAAVEAAGLACNGLCYPLNSFENRVYEVELDDKSRIIAKFYRPGRWSREQILEEHELITDLVEAEIPACPVRRFPDGTTLKRQDGIFYSLAERRGGRAPDELTDDLAERLGMLVGRMHGVAATRASKHRLALTADTYIRDNLAWLASREVVPDRLWPRYRGAAEAIADLTDEMMEGVAVQRLHGDLHLGNLLLRDGMFNVLDFDDSVVGPPVQDLWLALPGRDRYTSRQKELFLEGYERFRLFDRSTLRLIEPLRSLRLVHYATWLARRWHDPVFPATWPHFGSEDYWQQETEGLERQLELVRQEADPSGFPAAQEPEEELTNADYFWDWEG